MLQDVQTDAPVSVDVRVEHLGQEFHLGGFVRVVLCECDGQVENATFPNGVFWPEDDRFPVEERITARCRLDRLLSCILMHLLQVLQKASLSV